MTSLLGRLLGYKDVSSIDGIGFSFGSEWANAGPAWVLFGCVALVFLSGGFYFRFQARGRRRTRIVLAVMRAIVLCVLLLIVADPILEVTLTSLPRPVFWVLVDGTDSMNIADQLGADELEKLDEATGLTKSFNREPTATASANGSTNAVAAGSRLNDARTNKPSRADYVRALLAKDDSNLLEKLAENFRLRIYRFDRTDGVQSVELNSESNDSIDPKFIIGQLTAHGDVTAIGSALEDLSTHHSTANLAGALLISDFGQNSGSAPLRPARDLGIPIFTLGVGATHAVDLSVDLQMSLKMKRAEQTTVLATVRQQELDGETVTVRVTARQRSEDDGGGGGAIDETEPILIGERIVTLNAPSVAAEFSFTPEEAGRFVFTAEVETLEGEIVQQNNRAEREATIIDDFLRLLFVEYEPTWEWRFVKEVFHRDKLVGLRGFRTYLRSSDPTVRQTNDLFVPSLTMPRNEFFQHDVIFLGDMPAAALSSRFCEMTKEFVSKFGGGLVVMAGPRFGPGELADTPLAEMLPVVVDPDAQIRDARTFTLLLSPMASQFDFMRLGAADEENQKAWANLGRLPWYQPVKRVEPRASTVLAEHPTDTCIDGKTRQPLIAIRRYGRGEVIYLAHNEMWRLRRKYGEKYYRQFWGQLIHRLGLSHALGSHKRFVVRTDRQMYQTDDDVLVTVEAFDEDFEPLREEDLDQRHIVAEVVLPSGSEQKTKPMRITQFRPGIFETRLPVFDDGDYRIRVTDPITDEVAEVNFQVANLSAERRSAVRNVALQESLAAETNGKTYELDTVQNLLADFSAPSITETSIEIFPLWSTWLCFVAVTMLLLTEWFIRKMVNLT